jgi:peptidoglycan/xylan/chitin deacetylase (PgdA/CDA1 family)
VSAASPPPSKSALSGLPEPAHSGVPQPAGAPGGLRVVDWAGFRAALSYTFDDSNSSQIKNYDALQALGVPLTFYLETGKPESNDPVWSRALADGHELGNHTRSHLKSGDTIADDTDAATEFISSHFGVTPVTMAAPYGSTDYIDVAKVRFLVNRGVSDRAMAPNDGSDPFNLGCFVPAQGAAAANFDAKVDSARSSGRWQVVLVHGFTGGNDSAYQPVDLAEFSAAVEYAKSFGDVWIDTVARIAAYWRAQKLLSETPVATSRDRQTWTWKLPEHFPPGQYLRVVTNGGTLSQKGAPLSWDDHGYYEVALDEGRLTLGP